MSFGPLHEIIGSHLATEPEEGKNPQPRHLLTQSFYVSGNASSSRFDVPLPPILVPNEGVM
jgi:hypothetical protein